MAVYTSELDYDGFEADDCEVLLKDRLKMDRERLDTSLEALELLCEAVKNPKNDSDYIHYFCGNTEIPEDLKSREVQRTGLYKGIVSFIRAYANIADALESAGYYSAEIEHIKERMDHYVKLREIIRKASGESIDLKAYEADMRNLLDRYIQADESKVISPFGNMPLIDIIVKSGLSDAIKSLPTGIQGNKESVAETIENNVRSKIMKDHLLDPAYFEKMSILLTAIIKKRKEQKVEYEAYLQEISELINQVANAHVDEIPDTLDTHAKRALYNNLDNNESLALQIDTAVMRIKPDKWRGNQAKENVIKQAIMNIVGDIHEVERIFDLVKQQSEY